MRTFTINSDICSTFICHKEVVGKWVKCSSSQGCYDPTSAKSMEILPVDFCQFWIKHFWKRWKRQNIFASLSFSSKKPVSLKFLSCANVIPLDSGLHWNGIRARNIRVRYLGNELCLSSGNELLWCASNPCRLWEPSTTEHCFIDDSAGSSPFRRAATSLHWAQTLLNVL